MEIKERIDYLVDLINEANYNYHVLDNPTIEDVEYDKYLRELYILEEKYPELVRDDSPTKKIGGEPISEIIVRYVKFKANRKIYAYTKEEE